MVAALIIATVHAALFWLMFGASLRRAFERQGIPRDLGDVAWDGFFFMLTMPLGLVPAVTRARGVVVWGINSLLWGFLLTGAWVGWQRHRRQMGRDPR